MVSEDKSKEDTKSTAAFAKLREAIKSGAAASLVTETYCHAVMEQPDVKVLDFEHLKKYQEQINRYLHSAQKHADDYLSKLQPKMIACVTSVEGYFELHKAVKNNINWKTATKDDIESVLRELHREATKYQGDATGLSKELQNLLGHPKDDKKQQPATGLISDKQAFMKVVSDFNVAVGGDNGALKSLESEVDSIDSKFHWSIAGAVVSGLLVVGGIALMIVGAALELPSAGVSTGLVLGGFAMFVVGGVGVAFAVSKISSLLDEKRHAVEEEKELKDEIKEATALKSHFNSLEQGVGDAVAFVGHLEDSWTTLIADLEQRLDKIHDAENSSKFMQKILLGAIDENAQDVLDDVGLIKEKLAGVKKVSHPDVPLRELIRRHAAA